MTLAATATILATPRRRLDTVAVDMVPATSTARQRTNQYLEKISAKNVTGPHSHSMVAGGLPEMS